ncbi:hypothetical protein BROUX41_003504 [Berkeleyomyces rouxiae]|uniref:uncharacterized protein n=1 Tax=Berkeleyomyces rouxiae TaxID=2035830 RepID=UPI003B75DB13
MNFNAFFGVNENGESSSAATARHAHEVALWQAAATGFGGDSQPQALFTQLAQHQSQPLQSPQQPGLSPAEAAASAAAMQMPFGPAGFASGPQSTLAERPSQAQAQAHQSQVPQQQQLPQQSQQQMPPPRRRDHHGHDRKRPKTTPKEPALDSLDYWIHYDDDDEINKVDESFEINFARRNMPAQFQPRPIPPFNPLATTTPGLGAGLYTNPVNTILKPDDFIIDEAALENNTLSEDDDILDSMNLGEQLSKIDTMPPSSTLLPPRENLYSTPLSWEKPTLGNPPIRMEPSPLDAGLNPPPIPTNMDLANPMINEAEQRRLLGIALNSNRNVPYNAFPFGNYSTSLFAGGMGATMLNPETASLFEQAFNTSSFSSLTQTPNLDATMSRDHHQQQQPQEKQQAKQQASQQNAQRQYQQRQQKPQPLQVQNLPPAEPQILAESSPQTQTQSDSGLQQSTPKTEPKESPATASVSMANASYTTTATTVTTKTTSSVAPSAEAKAPPVAAAAADAPLPTTSVDHSCDLPKTNDRTAHNDIERKYRTNLKDKIAELRDAIPALRGLADEEEDDGAPRPQKVSKGTVLTKATDYIHNLERRNKAIMKEHQDLSRRLQAFEQLLNATARQPFLMPNYSRALFDPRGFC